MNEMGTQFFLTIIIVEVWDLVWFIDCGNPKVNPEPSPIRCTIRSFALAGRRWLGRIYVGSRPFFKVMVFFFFFLFWLSISLLLCPSRR